jgi:hypothetical protein
VEPSAYGLLLFRNVRQARHFEFVEVEIAIEPNALEHDQLRCAQSRSGDPAAGAQRLGLCATFASIARAAADSLARLPGQGADRRRSATINRQASGAHLALARSNTAAALEALQAVPDTLLSPPAVRLMKAQLLAARGQESMAAKVLDEALWGAGVLLVPTELERARIAERLADMPRALEGYRYVVGMWQHADPELQPFVTEARLR